MRLDKNWLLAVQGDDIYIFEHSAIYKKMYTKMQLSTAA